MKKEFLLLLVLLAGVTVFFPLLLGREFLFDDIEFVMMSPELGEVRSVGDLFRFHPQPTKPVTNFVLAASHLWGGGTVGGHRLFSLLLHLLNTLLIWLNLRYLLNRTSESWRQVPYLAALWFAIHPLHTETLGIAQFRGEILAATFSLICFLFLQRALRGEKTAWSVAGMAFAALLAQGSKEIMALLLPPVFALVLFFRWRASPPLKAEKKLVAGLALGQLTVWGLLFTLARLDAQGIYTYSKRVGSGALSWKQHATFATEALLEGLWKLLSGQGLTIVRLAERFPSGPFVGYGHFGLILGALCLAFLLSREPAKPFRVWVLAGLLAFLPYLAIPNVNIGSEHYWYFPLAVWGAAAGYLLFNLRVAKSLGVTLATVYLVLLGYTSFDRSLLYRRQALLYFSEVKAHPEAKSTWLDLIDGLIRSDSSLPLAKEALKEFEQLYPDEPRLNNIRLELAQLEGDWKEASSLLKVVDRLDDRPRVVARLHRAFAVFSAETGHCTEMTLSLQRARELDPHVPLPDPTRAFIEERCSGNAAS